METERNPIRPESVIKDLYNGQLNQLMVDLHKSITLMEYEHDEKLCYIKVNLKNMGYNSTVLNEVKRLYLMENWGNVFYIIVGDMLTFQLYFPQIKEGVR
jgi:hypothetical protein